MTARLWPSAGRQRRHFMFKQEPERVADLPEDHEAVVEGRTRYPSTVIDATDAPRLLVSGKNSRKIGGEVTRGPWRGMPMFTLTLEERATCPRDCPMWRGCYGNAMHWARRHRPDENFLPLLAGELQELADRYPGGFVVRLHVLGDFYEPDYVRFWIDALDRHRGLRVYGYTALKRISLMGQMIQFMNATGRCRIWFSGEETAVLDSFDEQPESGIVCPMQTGKTECCGTCGLCLTPGFDQRINFIKHGAKR